MAYNTGFSIATNSMEEYKTKTITTKKSKGLRKSLYLSLLIFDVMSIICSHRTAVCEIFYV